MFFFTIKGFLIKYPFFVPLFVFVFSSIQSELSLSLVKLELTLMTYDFLLCIRFNGTTVRESVSKLR